MMVRLPSTGYAMFHDVWSRFLSRARLALREGTHGNRSNRLRLRGTPSKMEHLESRVLPSVTPLVLAIARANPSTQQTNATSVSYSVTFNESVTGVDPTDFLVTTSGALQAAPAVVVSGSGAAYSVTVNSIKGRGGLELDLI